MIDHFLGNTTRLNLPPSTEFYGVIGSVRTTWLFFKLQLKEVGRYFFLIDNKQLFLEPEWGRRPNGLLTQRS